MINIELPPLNELVNDKFIEFLTNPARISLLWGGRGSGKTHAVKWRIIIRMLTEPKFKGVMVRKVYENIRETQFEELKSEIYRAGLQELFSFKTSPLEIRCVNGSRMIARGMDKAMKNKGIGGLCLAWYEEGAELEEDDFLTMSSTVRAGGGIFLEEIFSFNPESPIANYEEFWVYTKFFKDHSSKSFRSSIDVEIEGEKKSYDILSIHSTYKDNPHLPVESKAIIEGFKRDNPYYYTIYALGEWGNREVKGRFYRSFDLEKNTSGAVQYDPESQLHLSFDENVHPYLTLTIWQIKKNEYFNTFEALQIDEICLESPLNTLRDTCNEFENRYSDHKNGVFIYGDATSRKQDTKLEKGDNFFSLIENYLSKYNPVRRVPMRNPPIRTRADFMNEVFSGKVKALKVLISDKCTNTIADYLNVQEDASGAKLKTRVKDKRTGISFEKWGHTSDANDYFICEAFSKDFSGYSSPQTKISVTFGGKRKDKRF